VTTLKVAIPIIVIIPIIQTTVIIVTIQTPVMVEVAQVEAVLLGDGEANIIQIRK